MIFSDIGPVGDRFYVLGAASFPSYLVLGKRPALFDSGISCMGPLIIDHYRRIMPEKDPAYLFLTHAHFDHCGSVAQIKAAFPGIKVVASERAAQIVKRPNAIKLMKQLNETGADQAGADNPGYITGAEFGPFEVDIIVGEGDVIDLGDGLEVQALATPGHTRDFLTFHVPALKLVIASEAAGCPDRHGNVMSEFLVSYDDYMVGLKRLAELKPDILCPGHVMVVTGDDAPDLLRRTTARAIEYRETVFRLLDEYEGDQDKVVARIKVEQFDPIPYPKQSDQAYILNTQARVRHLAALKAEQ